MEETVAQQQELPAAEADGNVKMKKRQVVVMRKVKVMMERMKKVKEERREGAVKVEEAVAQQQELPAAEADGYVKKKK